MADDVVWVKTNEQVEPLPSAEVTRAFESDRHRGLGVCLYAIRVRAGCTFAVVEYPRDYDEAERLMYPVGGGLKLFLVPVRGYEKGCSHENVAIRRNRGVKV